MCIPQVAAMAAGAGGMGSTLAALGTVVQGVGAYQQGRSQAAAAEANAQIADAQAESSLEAGALEQRRLRRRGRQLLGEQRVAIATSGTGTGGTSEDLLLDTIRGVEEDAAMIRFNAERRAWGYQTQATQYRAQAKGAKRAGTGAMVGSLLGAGSQVLSARPFAGSNYTRRSAGYGSTSLIHPDRRY